MRSEYEFIIAGIAHTAMLTEDEAERYGATPVQRGRGGSGRGKPVQAPDKQRTVESK